MSTPTTNSTMTKSVVLGGGQTGCSLARHLLQKGQEVLLMEKDRNVRDQCAKKVGANNHLGKTFETTDDTINSKTQQALSTASAIYASPGVPHEHPVLKWARDADKPIRSDIEIFCRELISQEFTKTVKLVGITGTNGKSTVTSLVSECLKMANFEAIACGNIGLPVLELDKTKFDYIVMELSSLQLRLLSAEFKLQLQSAALLNLQDDHVDAHGSLQSVCAAKKRIFDGAKAVVYPPSDLNLSPPVNVDESRRWPFSEQPPKGNAAVTTGQLACAHGNPVALYVGDEMVMSSDETAAVRLKLGVGAIENALAAIAVCKSLGLASEDIAKGIGAFNKLPYRGELIGEVNEVAWYNDAKGTNLAAVIKAVDYLAAPDIHSFNGVHLVVGGNIKGQEFADLPTFASRKFVKSICVVGSDPSQIMQKLGKAANKSTAFVSLNEAVRHLTQQASPRDCVLFSPMAASEADYGTYLARGKAFSELVRQHIFGGEV